MKYSALSKYRAELMGLAMLWVMMFHAADLDLGEFWTMLRSSGFGGVDLFVLLSGMGLAVSLNRREQEYGAFLARRAERLLPAYYAVMLPYTVFLIVNGRAKLSALLWNSTLLSYWVRAEGGFNWYVCGIAAFYLVTPLVFRLLRRSPRRELLAAVGIGVGLALCQLLEWSGEAADWGYLDVFMRSPVFLLGLMVGFYVYEDRPLTVKSWVFWLLMLAAGVAYGVFLVEINSLGFLFMFCHAFLFTSVPVCLLFCLCFEHLPLGGLRRALRFVGENSLEIYLLHVSLFCEPQLFRPWLDLDEGHCFYYLATTALNFLLGWLLHWAIAWGVKKVKAVSAAHTNDRAGA